MNNQELTSVVREILLSVWDPCGVGDNIALEDEYDEYVPEIAALVAEIASSSTINQTLIKFEKELGVALPDQQRERAVRDLMAILCDEGNQ
jgi:hypothetical protein